MQIVSYGDSLHEMPNLVFFGEKEKKIFQYVVHRKFYPMSKALKY